MTRDVIPVDINAVTDLARLAREVARDGTPRVLREKDVDVAILSPARPKRRRAGKRPSQAEIDAALATFGTWTDLDAERFLRELDQARSDDRPPIDL
jgi:hypothetical protein